MAIVPARKRPLCHACGSPMAGHKRPNGLPVCPALDPPAPISARRSPLRRHDAIQDIDIPRSGVWHRRNPNWVEPEPVSDDEHSSHASWVPTEPADDNSQDEMGHLQDEEKVWGEEEDDQSESAASGSSSSSVTRTISQALMNSIPLASLFTSPSKDLPAITRSARRHGLNMGVMRPPTSKQGRNIKREDDGVVHETNLGRQNSWWIVMGRDSAAVSHILDLHERDAEGQQDGLLGSRANRTVGAYPVDPSSIRMTFLDVLIAGAIGGFVVFYGLSVL